MNINPLKKDAKPFSRVILCMASMFLFLGCSEVPRGGTSGPAVFNQKTLDEADVARGGRLYDKWWDAQNTPSTPPTEEQPLWALRQDITVQQEDSSSWRCKTCHGWDYKGADGSYSQANNPSKYTGFPGLLQLKLDEEGNPVEAKSVFDFIKNGVASEDYEGAAHKFGTYLSNQDLHDLTAFVVQEAWNDIGNPLSGSPTSGEAVFTDATKGCTASGCHDTPDKQQLIRNVANENPEEFLHKARFGQPGTAMVGGLNSVDAKHVLSFLRTGQISGNVGNFSTVKYAAASLSRGGLIFDKWWTTAANNTPPDTDHPKWPSEINDNFSGSDTWRCNQCHGWDYLGKDGVYSNGENYTGIKGIISSADTPVKYASAGEVYQFLKTDVDHAVGTILTEAEIYDVTLFVMSMREEALANKAAYQFIDNDTKRVIASKADVENGHHLYNGDAATDTSILCANCHGADGKLIDFGGGEFVGDVAINNPWEFIHKARFGDIDETSTMPGLVDNQKVEYHSPETAVDILAWAQDALVAKLDVAGRLYDNWAVEAKVSNAPQTTNPIWSGTGNTKKTGADTWRCKACHGWDYLGASGDYGNTASSYYTGITGLFGLATHDSTSLFNTIKNGAGTPNSSGHSFGQYLTDTQINNLVEFIQDSQGMITYESEKATANRRNGETLYKGETPGGCEVCHGDDGTLQAEPIGNIARSNVPEFLHKVRFGHPGSLMVPTDGGFAGLQPQQAYDVLKYVETLGADNTTPDPGYASASIVRGGRLYDKWWEEMKASDESAQAPTAVNPLWESRHSSVPDLPASKKTTDSWRCKTCHSWDYLGIGHAGGYRIVNEGTADERDTLNPYGADNLVYKIGLIKDGPLSDAEKQQQLFDWLKSGISIQAHDFSTPRAALPTVLGDVEIWDLVKFLMEGIINTDTYIYRSFKRVKGPYRDTTTAQGLYSGSIDPAINCASCHGEDGRGVAGKGTEAADIFALADENPWEFLHKTRFGQPNAPMPAFLDPAAEHSTIHGLNVLDYAQQKFLTR